MRILFSLIILIVFLSNCKFSDNSNQNELSILTANCKIDSIIKNIDFPFNSVDTIQIPDSFERFDIDSQLRKEINENDNSKLFYHSTFTFKNNRILTLIEDEEEYLSASVFVFNNCELTGKMIVSEKTVWENGQKTTKSIITNDSLITKITFTSSRDWGDYKQWKYDTIIQRYVINENGKIISKD